MLLPLFIPPVAPILNAGKILLFGFCSCLLFSFPDGAPKRFVELPLFGLLLAFTKGLFLVSKEFSVFPSLFDKNKDC